MKILSQHVTAQQSTLVLTAYPQRADNRRPSSAAPGPAVDGAKNQAIVDTLELSAAAEAQLAAEAQQAESYEETTPGASPSQAAKADRTTKSSQAEASTIGELSDEDQEVVDELKARDREVRTHEQAHLSAAGPYAKGGPTYDYQQGPDGQRYAVGGQVSIDTSPVDGDPQASIAKARVVRAAALAPAEPSAQDRAVAAAATKMEAQALQELRQQQTEEATEGEPIDGDEALNISAEFTSGGLLDLIA